MRVVLCVLEMGESDVWGGDISGYFNCFEDSGNVLTKRFKEVSGRGGW